MIDKTLQLIVCPRCKGRLEPVGNNFLRCSVCDHQYPLVHECPVLTPPGRPGAVKEQQVLFYTEVRHYLGTAGRSLGYAQGFNYLNFGYVADGSPEYALFDPPMYTLNRNSVKLTLEVLGHVSIDGKVLAEIGCGFGGNLATIRRYYKPAMLAGLDLCPPSVFFCRENDEDGQALYLVGDAEALPLTTGAFDIVFNLESSHAYPDKEKFYREVYRVLRPGGYFLYSDNLAAGEHDLAAQYLEDLGFHLHRNQDITPNILLSCDQIAGRRGSVLQELIRSEEQKALDDFVAAPGSEVYEDMRSRKRIYKIMEFQKTA